MKTTRPRFDLRQQAREATSLLMACAIVLGVLSFAVFSAAVGNVDVPSSASQSTRTAATPVKQDSGRDLAKLYLTAYPELRPVSFYADIEVKGWKSRDQRIVDAQIRTVQEVDAKAMKAAKKASATPVQQMSAQLRGSRVLASVDPIVADVLPSSGLARVRLQVTPQGEAATVLIDGLIEPAPAPGSPAALLLQRPSDDGIAAALGPIAAASKKGPLVTSLSQKHAGPGTRITITGQGFGATRGKGWVTCGGVLAKTVSWSSSKIVFTVPSKMRVPGYVGVVVNGVTSNGVFFVPFGSPVLTSVTPGEGPEGTVVVLKGRDFGHYQLGGWVTFDGSTAEVLKWSTSEIHVVVPRGAASGYMGVVANGMTSNGVLYGPHGVPLITSISRRLLLPGDTVTVNGHDFGGSSGARLTIGGRTITTTSWTSTAIKFTVPSGLTAGYLGVVRGNGSTSNGVFVNVAPKVVSLSQWWAAPGDELVIKGIDFGASQGSKSVFIGGVPASAVRWAADEVRFVVPEGVSSGYVGIGTPTACSNGIFLVVVTRANVSGVSPSSARPGDQITLTGSDFGPSGPRSTVVLHGGTTFEVVSWSPTSVVAIVPSGISSGYVGVSKYGVTSNGVWLTVLP